MKLKSTFLLILLLFFANQAVAQQDYYWVEGTGDWSEVDHWATTSGGSTKHLTPPTSNDNVFFDENSFTAVGQWVYITQNDAYCRDMDWRGASPYSPFFSSLTDGISLSISGSLWLIPEMDVQYFDNNINFEGTGANKTITTAGHLFRYSYFNFNGEGSEWILEDELNVYAIEFEAGELNFHDKEINCTDGIFIEGLQSKRLVLEEAILTVGRVFINNVGSSLIIEADNSLVRFMGGITSHFTSSADTEFYFHDVIFMDNQNDRSTIFIVGDLLHFNKITFLTGGYISGEFTVDSLIFSPGKNYELGIAPVVTVTIGSTFIANGTCDEPITITSDAPGQNAFIQKNTGAVDVNHVSLRDIHATGGATFNAHDSDDLGNNVGWNFTNTSRTLYWVGDGGDWNEPAHWSLSSGGPGGECVPTLADTVIFDAGSFSSSSQFVNIDSTALCHTMEWRDVTGTPSLDGNDSLYIAGSMTLSADMGVPFEGVMAFVGTNGIYTVNTAGLLLDANALVFDGEGGEWRLENNLYTNGTIYLAAGYLNSSTNDITCENFNSTNLQDVRGFSIDGSTLTTERFLVYADNLTVSSAHSEIRLTNDNVRDLIFQVQILDGTSSPTFNRVTFVDPDALGSIQRFGGQVFFSGAVTFNGDGHIQGNNTFDTLNFSPGRTYELAHEDAIQTIHDLWNTRGVACDSITLRSDQPGSQAALQIEPSRTVNADYLNVSDIVIQGGNFYAGENSSDGGNNAGWIFEADPSRDENLLGNDTTLCVGDTLRLDISEHYFNSESITISWNGNPVDRLTYDVMTSGLHGVTIDFGGGCVVTDEVNVEFVDPPMPDLGADTTLCEGNSLILGENLTIPPDFMVTWSDGSINNTLTVDTTGTYVVTLTNGGCERVDSIQVTFVPPPEVFLGNDTTLCEGEELVLTAPDSPGFSHVWQDGSSGQTLTVNTSDTYSIMVFNGGCMVPDSITVNFVPVPVVNLGNDTTVCGDSLVLGRNLVIPDGFTVAWSDGSNGDTLTVDTTGTYSVTLSNGGCERTGSINVTLVGIPSVELGNDTTLCIGENLPLDATFDGATYEWWQDGSQVSNDPVYTVSEPGSYRVTITNECETFTDSVQISYREPLEVDIGDTFNICFGEVQILRATTPNAMGYQWQDGSMDSVFLALVEGVYRVDVIDSCGNVVSDEAIVIRESCGCEVIVPTGFSSDAINPDNREFRPELYNCTAEVRSYLLNIFNKWGESVFRTEDINKGWNGTFNGGEELPAGTYVYSISLEFVRVSASNPEGQIYTEKKSGAFLKIR